MTYEQYWDMDCELVRAYREADNIRQERMNQELWLQGMYVYEALCDVAPILRAFPKKGTKPHKYPSQPYALTQKEQKDRKENAEKVAFEKGLAKMEALTKRMNQRFGRNEEKEVSKDADNR